MSRYALTIQAGAECIDTITVEAIPGTPFGTASLNLGEAAGNDINGLLYFDLWGLPRGARIVSATLSLWSASNPAVTLDFSVYSILRANAGWVEGATWNYAIPSTMRWAGDAASNGGADAGCSVSGTDYNATAIGTFTFTSGTPADTEHAITLAPAAVQAWADGNNYGMVIIRTSGTGAAPFWSSEAATSTLRPRLKIVYDYGGAVLARLFDPHTGRPLRDLAAWQ